jgi:hypothetical protein
MNQNNSKAILYYSKKCPHCAEVLNKIRLGENTINDFSEQFLYILVDGNNKLPNYITEVPTMVVPSHNKPLTGDSVFMWIDTKLRMSMQQKNANQTQSLPKNQPTVGNKSSENVDGPLSYNPMEMSGFGDSFSFLDNTGEVQEHCFTFIDENGAKQVKCVPAGGAPQNNQPQYQRTGQQNATQNNQQVPQWLQSENVGRQNSSQFSSATTYNPDVNAISMSHQNNIRLQQQARINNSGNRQIPDFQDPQRQPLLDNSKISDNDYERFMNSRNNDPGVQGAPQRI